MDLGDTVPFGFVPLEGVRVKVVRCCCGPTAQDAGKHDGDVGRLAKDPIAHTWGGVYLLVHRDGTEFPVGYCWAGSVEVLEDVEGARGGVIDTGGAGGRPADR